MIDETKIQLENSVNQYALALRPVTEALRKTYNLFREYITGVWGKDGSDERRFNSSN